MSRRDELRQQYLMGLCDALRSYIAAGHEVHIRTQHGRTARDNQIVFDIPEWDNFVATLDGRER